MSFLRNVQQRTISGSFGSLPLIALGYALAACSASVDDPGKSDASAPDASTPDGSTPDGSTPDASTPAEDTFLRVHCVDTYLRPTIHEVPCEFTEAPVLVVPAEDGGSGTIAGQVEAATGDLLFDVPPGEYTLRYTQRVEGNTSVNVVETDARRIDLSRVVRASGVNMNFHGAALNYVEIQNLDPSEPTDEHWIYSQYLAGPDTYRVFTLRYGTVGETRFGFALFGSPSAYEEPVWFFQRRVVGVDSPEAEVIIRSAPFAPKAGGEWVVAQAQSIALDRAASVDWESGPFLRAAAADGSRRAATYVEIRPRPLDVRRAVDEGAEPIVRVTQSGPSSRILRNSIAWGNPFDPSTQFLVAYVSRSLAAAPMFAGVQVVDTYPGDGKPLAATLALSKPRDFRVDGAIVPQATLRADSTFTWLPPSTGTPTKYGLRAFAYDSAFGGYRERAAFFTTRTSARFPAGALKPGWSYAFSLTAEQGASSTPSTPWQVSLPVASAAVDAWSPDLGIPCVSEDDCVDLGFRCNLSTGRCGEN